MSRQPIAIPVPPTPAFTPALPTATSDVPSTSLSHPVAKDTFYGEPPGSFERWLIKVALNLVIAISLSLWTFLLPIWMWMCVRTIIVVSLSNIVSIFSRRRPLDQSRVIRVVGLWPAGWRAILAIRRQPGLQYLDTADIRLLIAETGLCISFVITTLLLRELIQFVVPRVLVAIWDLF